MSVLFYIAILVCHITGIIILEVLCLTRLVWYYYGEPSFDILLIVATAAVIMIHYLLCMKSAAGKSLPTACIRILTLIDLVVAGCVILLLVVPNPVITVTSFGQIGLILVVQIVIITARCIFLVKTK